MVCFLWFSFVMNGHILLQKFDLSKGSCSFFLFRNGLTWACIGNNKLNSSKLIKDILLDNPLYLKVFSMLYLPRKDIGKYISFYKKNKN